MKKGVIMNDPIKRFKRNKLFKLFFYAIYCADYYLFYNTGGLC